MRFSIVMVAASAAVVVSCAKSPESISPAYVSEVGYQSWTCQQLAEESGRLTSAYAVAAQQQEKARSNDIAGVILIGLPVSSMSGDNIAPEIARLKGEQEAVRKASILKKCASAPALAPAVAAPATTPAPATAAPSTAATPK